MTLQINISHNKYSHDNEIKLCAVIRSLSFPEYNILNELSFESTGAEVEYESIIFLPRHVDFAIYIFYVCNCHLNNRVGS